MNLVKRKKVDMDLNKKWGKEFFDLEVTKVTCRYEQLPKSKLMLQVFTVEGVITKLYDDIFKGHHIALSANGNSIGNFAQIIEGKKIKLHTIINADEKLRFLEIQMYFDKKIYANIWGVLTHPVTKILCGMRPGYLKISK